ncbi:MAG: signal peptidase I [Snowella sp.]|nr:signal peptidase I [Snowella sp.]
MKQPQIGQLLKDPWLAVNLSMFFPGLGQLYGGKLYRGLVLILVQALFLGTGVWSILSPTGDIATGLIFLAIAIGIYIFTIMDALLLVYHQAPEIYQEKIPRSRKNPWFAVAVSRVIPGLGHFYLNQSVLGLLLFTAAIVSWRLQVFYWPLLILTPLITAIAAYHAYVSFSRTTKRTLISILAGLIFCLGLLANAIPTWLDRQLTLFVIPTPSMVPTLEVGDRLFVSDNPQYQPQRQDIIVFRPPEKLKQLDPKPAEYYTKRIIGLPGETVRIQGGLVYINDQPLVEDYLAANPDYELDPRLVPPNQYFVLGDNRNDSFDSHVWGFLPKNYIFGKAYKIYWPLNRVRSLLISDP